MPMPAKGPHLALRKRKGREPVWVIRDSGKLERATGSGDRRAAEIALARYIAEKHTGPAPAAGPLPPEVMTVADALAIYGEEHAPSVAAPQRISYAIKALVPFWGALPVAAITKETCRAYVKRRRRADGTTRRELNVLQAAINYCVEDGRLTAGRTVLLPASPATTQRALTRGEAAKLLRAARARGYTHVARFILIGLYTGTRASAILNLRLDRPSTVGGWFDLERGVMHRRGSEERETSKRRPPVRLPRQLWAHARRWRAGNRRTPGASWAVEWNRMRVAEMRHAFGTVARDADLGWRPTPHTLKHTAVTWFFQSGGTIEDAAAYFGTSMQTLMRVYRDASPRWQASAVAAVERMGRRG